VPVAILLSYDICQAANILFYHHKIKCPWGVTNFGRCCILKALHFFKGGAVFDALHQSIIQVRAFSAVRGSDALFPNDWGGLVLQAVAF